MDIRIAVSVGDLIIVNFGKPVIGGDSAGVAEYEPADGICHGAVFLHAPVGVLDIFVHYGFVIEHGGAHIAELFALAAVKDVRLCDIGIPRLNKDGFHAVLDILHGDKPVFDLGFEIRGDFKCKEIYHIRVRLLFACLESLFDSVGDLSQIEFGAGAVAFYYAVHLCFLRLYNKLFIVPCSMAGAHACGAFLAYHNIVALSTEKSTTYCVSAFCRNMTCFFVQFYTGTQTPRKNAFFTRVRTA